MRSSINPDIHHSKVPSSERLIDNIVLLNLNLKPERSDNGGLIGILTLFANVK